MSFVIDMGASTFDDRVVEGLELIQNHVLQVPFFLMSILSRVTPTLDNMYVSRPNTICKCISIIE